MKNNNIKTILLSLLVMALWGSLYPFIKIGYSAFKIDTTDIPSIMLFAGLRFVICGMILIVACSAKDKKLELPQKSDLLWVIWGAVISIILHYGFTYIALSLGEGSKSAIIKQVGFLFLSCFAFIFDKTDGFSPRKLMAGILGFAGIIVTGIDGSGVVFGLGDALLILASACSAIATVVSKRATQTIAPAKFVAYTQLIGGIFLAAVGAILGGKLTHVDGVAVAALSYICIASIAAYVLWNSLLKNANMSMLSVIKCAEPLFACLFGALLLKENIFKWQYLVALILISVGIVISNKKAKYNNSISGEQENESNHL